MLHYVQFKVWIKTRKIRWPSILALVLALQGKVALEELEQGHITIHRLKDIEKNSKKIKKPPETKSKKKQNLPELIRNPLAVSETVFGKGGTS